MNKATLKQQHGLSMSGFLFGSVVLVLIVIASFKMISAYMESATIQSLFISVASDPDMEKANTQNILRAYSKRAVIENITAISLDDIDVEDDNGTLILSASYTKKVHLAGNVSLHMEFNPSSDTR